MGTYIVEITEKIFKKVIVEADDAGEAASKAMGDRGGRVIYERRMDQKWENTRKESD